MSCCGARVIVEPSAGTSGSNFPSGISVGTGPTTALQVEGVVGVGCLATVNPITAGLAPFQVSQLYAGGLGTPYASYGQSSIQLFTSLGAATTILNGSGLTLGSSDGIISLSSLNTTTATALLQGTPGKDPSLRIGTAVDYTNIYKSGITFYDADVGGTVNFATYGGGAQVLLSSVETINGRSPVLDNGSNIKVTTSGNDVLDATGQAVITLPFSYKDANSFSVLVTQTSSQPIVPPWAKINTSSEIQLNGDSNATISWMTFGIL